MTRSERRAVAILLGAVGGALLVGWALVTSGVLAALLDRG